MEDSKKSQTVRIPLPKGMSQEEFNRILGTLLKTKVQGKQKDTAFRATLARFKEIHFQEWHGIYAEELTKIINGS